MEHNGKLMEHEKKLKTWQSMMEKCMEHRGKLMDSEWRITENERKPI